MTNTIVKQQFKIIQPLGQINASNATEFQSQLINVLSSDEYLALLIDMQQVEFIDSAGLMVLVSSLRLAQTQRKRFGLCSVNPSIKMIFELTQLEAAFEIFESHDAFIAKIEAYSF
ncbi:MAG: STAS domain-containing protein [Coleofasciculaceae cyanobacterium]